MKHLLTIIAVIISATSFGQTADEGEGFNTTNFDRLENGLTKMTS